VLDKALCDKVCHWFARGRWFSPGTPVNVSSTNKTDRHGITEIVLKVALDTTTLTQRDSNSQLVFIFIFSEYDTTTDELIKYIVYV
jgi:hypothetical protein